MARPPAFVPTLRLSHKFRFQNAAGSTVSITRKNLLNLIQVATSATTTIRVIEGIRLRSLELWVNPVALGSTPSTAQIEWAGENSPSTVVSDTSMGVLPVHIRTTPPPSSSNRWWSMSGSQETDVLFTIAVPANSVLDVIVEIRTVEQEAPVAGDIPVGAVLGTTYGNYLDGIAGAAWAPVGWTVLP